MTCSSMDGAGIKCWVVVDKGVGESGEGVRMLPWRCGVICGCSGMHEIPGALGNTGGSDVNLGCAQGGQT